jgi:signal peptidase I
MKQGQLYINGQMCPRESLGSFETDDSGYVQREKLYMETLPNGVRHEILKATDGTDASRRPGFDPAKEFDPNNTIDYVVPPDHVFAMGDHRDNSADSRFMNAVGFVPVENLVGRAEILFFSIDSEHPWYEVWYWPFDIRWSRLLQRIR